MSGTAGGARGRVARLLESKYGEQVDPMDHFPAAWAADADELLDVVADTTAGEALPPNWPCPACAGAMPADQMGAPLQAAHATHAARSGGAQDDGLRGAQEKCATTGLDADVCFGDCCCLSATPLLALLEPGDPNARMDAYYYGFERTGVGIIDAILSAVAQAGKSYHGTDMWAEEDEWTKPSHEQRIQDAADAAADRLRRALAGPDDARQDGAR